MSTLPCSASSAAQRRPRKRFRIDEDLCLLREVAAADPYQNPAAWEEILRNLMLAVMREFTIRAIKERVDLLVGYFRQQDNVNLRRSGTEEQYGEREQLLQEISDLMKNAGYVPRTLPRTSNGTGPRRHTALARSATVRQRLAREIRDAATSSMNVSDGGETHGEGCASDLLLSMYASRDENTEEPSLDRVCYTEEGNGDEGSTTRPSQQVSAVDPSPLDTTQAEQATEESEVDEQAQGPIHTRKRQ
ncbi:uncharacterized protein [Dermacentor albipictus]|uniref:uncharacterized protein n=1 Tax=Dermacentor albipictus TaxID=60249 RepID=UPI0038FCA28C